MTLFRMVNEFQVTGTTAEDLEEWATSVFDQVIESDDVRDADMDATLAAGEVTFTFDIEAATVEDAIDQGRAVVRAALRIVDGEEHPYHRSIVADGRRVSASKVCV